MQDLSEEEKQRRIDATNANPWVQLARLGEREKRAEKWNSFMLKFTGRDRWPEELLAKTNPMEDVEYEEWYKKLKINSNACIFTIDLKNLYFSGEVEFYNFFLPFGINVDFSGSVFCEEANFYAAIFQGSVRFSKVSFREEVIFQNTVFDSYAEFIGATFVKAIFYQTTFRGRADFSSACFLAASDSATGRALFSNAKFQTVRFNSSRFYSDTMFANANFENNANLEQAHFEKEVRFDSANFAKEVSFSSSVFKNNVYFRQTIFGSEAQFRGVKFEGVATFIGSKFKLFANFQKHKNEDTVFSYPPHFEGVECDAIYIKDARFDKSYRDIDSLEAASSAWAALIRLMERVHNLPMRHEFHKKLIEVEAQYKTEKYAKPLYFIHSLLGAGQSAFIPFYWWVSFNVLFFAYYSSFVTVVSKAFSFTLMNSIPFITTFNRTILDAFIKGKEDIPSYIMFGAGVHTFLSGIFIFFIGLALRNRFRMKS